MFWLFVDFGCGVMLFTEICDLIVYVSEDFRIYFICMCIPATFQLFQQRKTDT